MTSRIAPTLTSQAVEAYLEENAALLEAVHAAEASGNVRAALAYAVRLQQNLLHLGVHADRYGEPLAPIRPVPAPVVGMPIRVGAVPGAPPRPPAPPNAQPQPPTAPVTAAARSPADPVVAQPQSPAAPVGAVAQPPAPPVAVAMPTNPSRPAAPAATAVQALPIRAASAGPGVAAATAATVKLERTVLIGGAPAVPIAAAGAAASNDAAGEWQVRREPI
jgi:hypothetical protein